MATEFACNFGNSVIEDQAHDNVVVFLAATRDFVTAIDILKPVQQIGGIGHSFLLVKSGANVTIYIEKVNVKGAGPRGPHHFNT